MLVYPLENENMALENKRRIRSLFARLGIPDSPHRSSHSSFVDIQHSKEQCQFR